MLVAIRLDDIILDSGLSAWPEPCKCSAVVLCSEESCHLGPGWFLKPDGPEEQRNFWTVKIGNGISRGYEFSLGELFQRVR